MQGAATPDQQIKSKPCLGLFGRLGSFSASLLGLGVYAAQVALSDLWLRHFHFGPAEWVWRSLSYGRLQPFKVRRP